MNEEINKFLTRKFNRYSLIYYANGKERKSSDCIAKINCYIEGQKVVKFAGIVESPVFTIKFFKNDPEIPPNEIKWYGQDEKLVEKYGPVVKINLHYPLSQFNDIISILRHEKPPFYLFIEDKDSPKGGLLTEGLVDDNKYEDIPIKYYSIDLKPLGSDF